MRNSLHRSLIRHNNSILHRQSTHSNKNILYPLISLLKFHLKSNQNPEIQKLSNGEEKEMKQARLVKLVMIHKQLYQYSSRKLMKREQVNKYDGSEYLAEYLDPRTDQKIISLPLEFEYLPVEVLSKQFTKLNSNHSYRIHYLGPRFTDTQVLHKKYSGQYSKTNTYFEHLYNYSKYQVQMRKIIQSNYLNEKLQNNHYYRSAIFYRAFEGMNPTLNFDQELMFNSCFESGNLDCVIKVNPSEFDLFLRIDSNTRGHTQWFYFSINNGKKLGKFTFNICNLTKPHTLYEQQNNFGISGNNANAGMKPYIFSRKKYENKRRLWEQDGANVILTEKPLRYNLVYEMIDPPTAYRLSFDYIFDEEDDQVYFAYSIPYTYSQMLGDIEQLQKNCMYVKRNTLGRSLTGVDIPILHITNHLNSGIVKKKNILITGRIHPGESNGSHVLKGFMEFICSNCEEAQALRNRINFFIVPMINPDGVIMGNSRTSGSGKDLNRQYLTSKRELYPEVVLIKNLAYKLQKNDGIFLFLDFHGHSRKKNTFFYGPGYSLAEIEYYKSRALAKLIQKNNPNFRYYSCSFMISQEKKKTARAVLFQQFKIPYVFTIQSSIGLYHDAKLLKTLQFTAEEWEKTGASIGQGLSEFILAHEQYEEVMRERRLERQRKKKKNGGNNKKVFEEDTILEQQNTGPKKPLLLDLLDEVKNASPSKNNQNEEISSDDHDDAEDLQSSKLAQFNTLVIQTKQKVKQTQSNNLQKIQEGDEYLDQPIILSKPKRTQTEGDEMQMIKQMEQEIESRKRKSPTKMPIVKRESKSSNNSNNNTGTRPPFIPSSLRSKNQFSGMIMPPKETYEDHHNIIQRKRNKYDKNETTHRQIISKQFFPVDKCEILDLPATSYPTRRKQAKKGRVMIEDYLNDKKKEKELLIISHNENTQSPHKKFMNSKGANPKYRSSSLQNTKDFERQKNKTSHSVNNNIFGLNSMNFDVGNSRNRLLKRSSTISNKKNQPVTTVQTPNSPMRIFDSTLFSGLQGLEIDNMAMMIRTFNR